MNQLTDFQAQSAAIALNKLFTRPHFSICDFDAIATLIGATPAGPDYQAIRTLHCVNWGEIPEPMRTQLREKIIELLGLPPEIITSTARREPADIPQPPPESRGNMRLAFWRKP